MARQPRAAKPCSWQARKCSFADCIIQFGAALVVPLEIERVGPSHESLDGGELSRAADDLAAKCRVGPARCAVRHNDRWSFGKDLVAVLHREHAVELGSSKALSTVMNTASPFLGDLDAI